MLDSGYRLGTRPSIHQKGGPSKWLEWKCTLTWVKTGSERIIRDMEVYEEIAAIHGSGIQFTEIKWLPCVSFKALLALFSPLVITVLFCVTDS